MQKPKIKNKVIKLMIAAILCFMLSSAATFPVFAEDAPPVIDDGGFDYGDDSTDTTEDDTPPAEEDSGTESPPPEEEGIPELAIDLSDPDPDPGAPPETSGASETTVVTGATTTTTSVTHAASSLPETGPALIIPAIVAAGVAVRKYLKK